MAGVCDQVINAWKAVHRMKRSCRLAMARLKDIQFSELVSFKMKTLTTTTNWKEVATSAHTEGAESNRNLRHPADTPLVETIQSLLVAVFSQEPFLKLPQFIPIIHKITGFKPLCSMRPLKYSILKQFKTNMLRLKLA